METVPKLKLPRIFHLIFLLFPVFVCRGIISSLHIFLFLRQDSSKYLLCSNLYYVQYTYCGTRSKLPDAWIDISHIAYIQSFMNKNPNTLGVWSFIGKFEIWPTFPNVIQLLLRRSFISAVQLCKPSVHWLFHFVFKSFIHK